MRFWIWMVAAVAAPTSLTFAQPTSPPPWIMDFLGDVLTEVEKHANAIEEMEPGEYDSIYTGVNQFIDWVHDSFPVGQQPVRLEGEALMGLLQDATKASVIARRLVLEELQSLLIHRPTTSEIIVQIEFHHDTIPLSNDLNPKGPRLLTHNKRLELVINAADDRHEIQNWLNTAKLPGKGGKKAEQEGVEQPERFRLDRGLVEAVRTEAPGTVALPPFEELSRRYSEKVIETDSEAPILIKFSGFKVAGVLLSGIKGKPSIIINDVSLYS